MMHQSSNHPIIQSSKLLTLQPSLFGNLYKGKRVLVTGHTGFKGSWLSIWLLELGAEVVGYALEPCTEKDNFVVSKLGNRMKSIIGDVRDYEKLLEVFKKFQPEFVFHLAAQSLVRLSYEVPVETFETNIMGTVNVLEAIRNTESVKVGILATSDKCYENKGTTIGYKETDRLGGHDPYSASKGCAELVIDAYLRSFFNPNNYEKHGKSIASVRAGNVIGGGDWAKDRIIPDCIRALERDQAIMVRNPSSTRPWQHVLDPLRGYLLLGQMMWEEPKSYCEPWNFGPDLSSAITVAKLVDLVIKYYGTGSWKKASGSSSLYEASYLALDCQKATEKLQWEPVLTIPEAVELTIDWYKKYRDYDDCYELAREEIDKFIQRAQKAEMVFPKRGTSDD
jgi:CDP-glucose 4,6-dehydratase